MAHENEIAIVGIGCNFSGGEGYNRLWRVLESGKNCATEIPRERFNVTERHELGDDGRHNKIGLPCAALLEEFNAFDNKLFGINNEEAEHVDPQEKLLLECTYRALEDAGIPTEKISGTKTGVFLGLMNENCGCRAVTKGNHDDGTRTLTSTTANRISCTFNLTGPSLIIDTVCSSFLSALHFGCKAIKQGDCESALCGGVNCIMDPGKFLYLNKGKVSDERTNKPLFRKTDDYEIGEGCGILLLKPLKKAQEEFSKIWGVISASAVSQNGRCVASATQGNPTEQEKLLLSIYPACTDPSAVQYIETQSTGNFAEDATVADRLGNYLGTKRSPYLPPLKIGSVTGNIGYTKSACGAAGLIKVLLMMHHGKIVPSVRFLEGMNSTNIERLNISVPTRVENWDDSGEFGRIAGINCFGSNGNNAHVVVRQIKQTQDSLLVKRPTELFVISAASSNSLRKTLADTARHLSINDSTTLPNLAYTSACRRSHKNCKYRKAFVASSLQHLKNQLVSGADVETVPLKKLPQLIFAFSSNELNFKGICKTLLRLEPVFRDKCIEIKQLYQQLTPIPNFELTRSADADLSRPEIAQPLFFMLQVGLVELLRHWGIKPVATVGHSVGEVAAAHCAGLISLEDAVRIIYHRSRLQAKVTRGKMLVVGNIPIQQVSAALEAYSGQISVAAINSPQSCTLSGEAESISALQKHLAEKFSKRNPFLHVLNVPVAYHSHMMDPVLTEMEASLSELKKGKLAIELISTATRKAASNGDFVTGNYWARQARDTVAFADALITLAKDKDDIAFVEIGSQSVLQSYITETLGSKTKVFHSMQIDQEYEALLNLVKDCFELGFNVDWQHFYEGYQSIPSAFPRYQFDHQKFLSRWSINQQESYKSPNSSHPFISRANEENSEFICTISESLMPYLFQYKHHSRALIPDSFFVELALAAVMTSSKPKVPLRFCQMNIIFTESCILHENSQALKIKVEPQQNWSVFRIHSESGHKVYASGQVTKTPETLIEEKEIYLKDIFQRCSSSVNKDEVYEALAQLGLHYGDHFRQLNDLFYCENLKEVVTTVQLNTQMVEEMHEYYIHPVLLDCFLQMVGVLASLISKNKIVFPSSISSLVVAQCLQEEMVIYLKTSMSTNNCLQFCGCFTDKNGSVLAELKCVQATFIKEIPKKENDTLFENNWKEITFDQTMQNLPKAPRAVVFTDKFGIAQQLKNYLHSESKFLTYQEWEKLLLAKRTNTSAQAKMKMDLQRYDNVLFMWGIQKLNESLPEKVVKYSVRCCEAFRQVVIALREKKSHCSITVITYRTSGRKVDHINTGFVLYGMTRTCMVEVPEITFQIVDISSTNSIDISALADVLVQYKAQDYPEVWIDEGRIYCSEIRRTQTESTAFDVPFESLQNSELCSLYTSDPYVINKLSAEVTSPHTQLGSHSVEIQMDKMTIHSEDYFPVSVSSCKYRETLYWNSYTKGKHQVLALDFSGTVTAIGTEVKKVKVGDHIVSCYPVSAATKISIPEAVCFRTQKFSCFRNSPCMSFFWLAREILLQRLPVPKHSEVLGIISTEPESVLCKVLTILAQESGWHTIVTDHMAGLWQRVNQSSALIFLPPLNGIFKEGLSCLFHLQDVVLIYGNKQPERLQYLIDHENIRLHSINLINIFQKASLIRSQKEIDYWLKSINMKQLQHLPSSIFQHTGMPERSDIETSYFNCKQVPIAVLKRNENSEISDISIIESGKSLFKQNAIYIITGGLTGLGFETVKFVAQNGGGHVVILSRGKSSPQVQKEINDLQDHCGWSRIISLQCNVIFSSEVEKAIKSISKIFPNCPVKGIFHSAMVLNNGRLETLTMSHFEEVLSPKIAGAINLHHVMRGHDLDHFVCYSSFSSFLGSPTQSNYAAANSFLDLFCHYRRNSGLAGQSINWGDINTGSLHGHRHDQHHKLQLQVLEELQVNDIHEQLKRSLILNNCQQAVVKLNLKTLADHTSSQNLSLKNRFCSLIFEEMGSNSEFTSETIPPNLGPIDYIISLLKSLTNTSPGGFSMRTRLSSLGIDSILAITLQHRIFVEKGVEIPLVKLLDPHSTVSMLILFLKENLQKTDSNVGEDIDAGSWL
ncbi:uncharacterized protein LOC134497669 [Candoia aspera]|uniref:uncharacterized protein LOC134497669 n=1 Tax=Candoia aspera TaxID=51853 RepID=UPI002FD7C5CB